MKNLEKIVDKIEKNIDDKDKIREQALRASREIIIGCRVCTFNILELIVTKI